jgi:hypothetical protein
VEDDGLIFAEHFARSDAEQKSVSDLTGGAGDCNANGILLCHGCYSFNLQNLEMDEG